VAGAKAKSEIIAARGQSGRSRVSHQHEHVRLHIAWNGRQRRSGDRGLRGSHAGRARHNARLADLRATCVRGDVDRVWHARRVRRQRRGNGIGLEPQPVDASRAFFSRPDPPNPKPLALDWSPAPAGIAASADFGFTTGPLTLTDRASGRSLRNRIHFPVWTCERNAAALR